MVVKKLQSEIKHYTSAQQKQIKLVVFVQGIWQTASDARDAFVVKNYRILEIRVFKLFSRFD